jgi:hypothetical protein
MTPGASSSPLLQGGDLFFVELLQDLDALARALFDAAHLRELLLVRRVDLAPMQIFGRDLRHHLAAELASGREDLLFRLPGAKSRRQRLPFQQLDQALAVFLAQNPDLVFQVLGHAIDVGLLDLERAGVLFDSLAAEDLDVDDRAFDARRRRERRVANVAGLLAEDGAEQLFFRRELGLALRRDLADEDVARLDVSADADDARLVEVFQELLGDVRDVARDLFGTQLGVARFDLELLDVNRGERVFADQLLRHQDGVFEVVTAPRHERDEDVAAERQLAPLGARPVGHDLPLLDALALPDDRDAG